MVRWFNQKQDSTNECPSQFAGVILLLHDI